MSPSGSESLQVACAVQGEGYVAHCAAMLRSLFVTNTDVAIAVHYVHGEDDSTRMRDVVAEMVRHLGGEIVFYAVPDAWLSDLPLTDYTKGGTFSAGTWYRIFLPELVRDAELLLYLDCDLLVTGSLMPLWNTPLRGNLLAAVTNVLMRQDSGRAQWLGMPSGQSYFNAGVMLMDAAAMRREGTTERLRAYAVEHPERLGWWDQDALNIKLGDRRLALHPRYNCTNALMNFDWATEYFDRAEVEEARRNPAIRHFEGPDANKPWHLLGDSDARALYAEHRRHTPWPRVHWSGRTPANLLRYALSRGSRVST